MPPGARVLDLAPRYRVKVSDRFWKGVYLPIAALLARAANSVAWLQQGRISVYLLYSFVTLVATLMAVMR